MTVWTTSETDSRVNQSVLKDKYPFVLAVTVFVIAVLCRWHGRLPPYDDLYHLKRITSVPTLIEFDRDRGENGAWCPWPPLYDVTMSVLPLGLAPVFGFAAFAAAIAWLMARRAGLIAGVISGGVLAISPYLIDVSHRGAIDHHWVEPMLVAAILFATEQRRPIALGIALTVAMFVQTALLIAAGLAFVIGWRSKKLAVSFAIPAMAIALYRITRPPGYPDTIWFLGWPHAAVFAAAALCIAGWMIGAILVAPYLATLASGFNFLGGDPWLRSILEFQPMFHDPSRIGTDIANLTGGALLGFALWRRERTIAIFSIAYFVLALSSRRFLVPGIAIFAIAGALTSVRWRWVALAMTLLPPLCYDAYALAHPDPQDMTAAAIGQQVAALPSGRILAPWWLGHAIDVIGKHAVVIDNFGSMPGDAVFTNANEALLQRHPDKLLAYMKQRDIRYLVLPYPGLANTAAAIGVDPKLYAGTKLAQSTVWWRLTHDQRVPGFTACSKTRCSLIVRR